MVEHRLCGGDAGRLGRARGAPRVARAPAGFSWREIRLEIPVGGLNFHASITSGKKSD